jgi:hypothetical protein
LEFKLNDSDQQKKLATSTRWPSSRIS